MNRMSVFKWCGKFKNDCTSVHGDQRSGRSSKSWNKTENAHPDYRNLCYTKPSQKPSDIGNCPRGGSQNSWPTNTSFNRLETGQWLLRLYKLHSDEFLRSIVTGNETWVHTTYLKPKGSTGVKGEKYTNGLAGYYFKEVIKKLIPRFTTCIERKGDYVEK